MSKLTEEARKLVAESTQGIWTHCCSCGPDPDSGCKGRYIWLDVDCARSIKTGRGDNEPEFTEQDRKDLALVAWMRNNILALCDEAENAQKEKHDQSKISD